jgi:hypothetical protein
VRCNTGTFRLDFVARATRARLTGSGRRRSLKYMSESAGAERMLNTNQATIGARQARTAQREREVKCSHNILVRGEREPQTLLPALSRQSELTVWTKLRGSGATLQDLSDRWITMMMPIGARLPNGSVKPLAESLVESATLLLAQADNRPCAEPMLIAHRESAAVVVAAILVRLGATFRKKGLMPFHHPASQHLL